MRETLRMGLPALGLDPALSEPLEAFSRMLLERNRVMNLTAITEPRDVAALHLLDSLELIPLAGLTGETVVDVGTGAGFPGVPLAVALPEAKVTLLDSLGKRVDFLREACGRLGLDEITLTADEDRRMILYHTSGASVMIGNSILCKRIRYSVSFGDVIYITSEDKVYDLEIHYIAVIQ